MAVFTMKHIEEQATDFICTELPAMIITNTIKEITIISP